MSGGEEFKADAKRYSAFRPDYPAGIMRHVTDLLTRQPPVGGTIFDVGAGTGIFTRQLRATLTGDFDIVGVEPSESMLAKARELSPGVPGLSYHAGTAERVDATDGSARAVIAATAAHWFDRPTFYEEAKRLLIPDGLLAIVEYLRDEACSPAAASLIRFTAENGGKADYDRPDYAAELTALTGFGAVETYQESFVRELTTQQYVGLALSSSHAQAAIEHLGSDRAEQMLLDLGKSHANADGLISFGYVFQAFTVRAA